MSQAPSEDLLARAQDTSRSFGFKIATTQFQQLPISDEGKAYWTQASVLQLAGTLAACAVLPLSRSDQIKLDQNPGLGLESQVISIASSSQPSPL